MVLRDRRTGLGIGDPTRDLDVEGLRRLGRSRRGVVGRRSLKRWTPSSARRNPVELLRESNSDRLQSIAPIRIGRMAADPFAFLRGGAAIMAADIADHLDTGINVQACGDAHLMNFGVFATTERNLVFDLNDFDETHEGPWEWDLQRLAASVVVAGRVHGAAEDEASAAAQAVGSAYRERMGELCELSALERRYVRLDVAAVLASLRSAEASGQPLPVERQVEKARRRDRFQALERFTELREGRRVIISDPPLVQPLPADAYREELLALYSEYRSTLPHHVVSLLEDYRFIDIALKVVGVGSVGTRALMVLLTGRSDGDPLFLQVKEANGSVLAVHRPASAHAHQGRRIVEGQRLMQAAGDMFLGWGSAGGRDYFVRQLRDMKGSIDLSRLRAGGLAQYARFCGVALAHAHARSRHPALISGYLGRSGRFDESLAYFAEAYADQTERDHQALVDAVRSGNIAASSGI
jgi:uncharacterized protein (DUF2252 family)